VVFLHNGAKLHADKKTLFGKMLYHTMTTGLAWNVLVNRQSNVSDKTHVVAAKWPSILLQ
jgi:hypothetical protein